MKIAIKNSVTVMQGNKNIWLNANEVYSVVKVNNNKAMLELGHNVYAWVLITNLKHN